MQIRRFRGRRTVMSLRLCSRAPWTTSSSAAIEGGHCIRRTRVRTALSGEVLHEPGQPGRVRHERDLELPCDDGPVAEYAAEERLLDLDAADPGEPHGGGSPPHETLLDDEALAGHDDVRPVPAPDRERRDEARREQEGAAGDRRRPTDGEADRPERREDRGPGNGPDEHDAVPPR